MTLIHSTRIPYCATCPGAFILGGTDEIQTVLDDQIVKIQAMNASPFVKPFKERAGSWEATLQNLQVGGRAVGAQRGPRGAQRGPAGRTVVPRP